MTGRQLTVHNASVTTMTVEVKTLTIGTRQVTQGIFRQLIDEDLISRDGSLNGTPWGHVTWHPDNCATSDRPHWHIVWQKGDELRRARVSKALRHGDFGAPEANDLLNVWISEAAHGRMDCDPLVDLWAGDKSDCILSDPISQEVGVKVWADASRTAVKVAACRERLLAAEKERSQPLRHADLPYPVNVQQKQQNAGLNELVDRALAEGCVINPTADLSGVTIEGPDSAAPIVAELSRRRSEIVNVFRWSRKSAAQRAVIAAQELGPALVALDAELTENGLSWESARAAYERAVRAEAARRQRHRDVRATLAGLPQLFIGG